ncbi:hypothetical protein ACEQ8H_008634 [Pleosporales sp. CAS-2024a]
MYCRLGFKSLLTTFFAVAALAAQSSNTGYSTFIYPTGHGNLTFALSAASSGELYMHLSGPVKYQWIGVGTGSQMAGSVMLLVYSGASNNGTGHVEPSYSKRIDCALDTSSSSSSNGITINSNHKRFFSANIICRNISTLGSSDSGGQINLNSPNQPMIYAWGPTDEALSSASKSAGIKRHAAYGTFYMDLKRAQVSGSSSASAPGGDALQGTMNAGEEGAATQDGDSIGPAHSAIMIVAFLVIFPLGAVLLRYLESVRAHYMTQSLGLVFAVAGTGLGIYLGTMYNKSKNMSSGHQVFGLILCGLLLVQWLGGLLHHLRFRKYKRPTMMGKAHLFLGPTVVLGGIINAFIGLDLAGNGKYNKWYGIAVAIILFAVIVALAWKKWHTKKEIERQKADGHVFAMEPRE